MTDEKEHWTLDKRVPIALIVTVIIQFIIVLVTGTIIATKMDSRILFLEESRKSDVLIISEVVKSQNVTNIALAEIKKDQSWANDTLKEIRGKLGK